MNRLTGLSTLAFPSRARSSKMVGATHTFSWSTPVPSRIISNRPLSTPLGVCRNSLQLAERGPF